MKQVWNIMKILFPLKHSYTYKEPLFLGKLGTNMDCSIFNVGHHACSQGEGRGGGGGGFEKKVHPQRFSCEDISKEANGLTISAPY